MLKKGFLYVFFLFLALEVKAQSYELSIGSIAPLIKDTAEMYSKLGIDFWVVNTGESTVYETITANVAANPTETATTSRVIGWISFQEGVGLDPGDSVRFEWNEELQDGVYDDVTPQNVYDGGDNIIVVWPAVDAPSTQMLEKYYHGLYVTGGSDVKEVAEKGVDFNAFFYEGSLEIVSAKEVSKIAMFNVEGKQIYKGVKQKIFTKDLPVGVYIVQVEFKDGSLQSCKVLVK